MKRGDVLVLRVAAAWTVFIWVTRIGNVLRDSHRGFGFKTVHTMLAVVSVALAVAVWRVASRAARRRSTVRP